MDYLKKRGKTMAIAAIWAEDEQGLIGVKGRLPWHLPAELAHFKATTMGGVILMGRKTFDGMNKRILPGRTTIVMTQNPDYDAESDEVLVMHSVEEVLAWYAKQDKALFITGGAEILQAFSGSYDLLFRTLVHAEFVGDAYFPQAFDFSAFKEVESRIFPKNEKNAFDFTVKKYEKIT